MVLLRDTMWQLQLWQTIHVGSALTAHLAQCFLQNFVPAHAIHVFAMLQSGSITLIAISTLIFAVFNQISLCSASFITASTCAVHKLVRSML